MLDKNPSDAEAWNNMGLCARAMGRDDLSRQYFERAKDLRRYNKEKIRRRNLDALV